MKYIAITIAGLLFGLGVYSIFFAKSIPESEKQNATKSEPKIDKFFYCTDSSKVVSIQPISKGGIFGGIRYIVTLEDNSVIEEDNLRDNDASGIKSTFWNTEGGRYIGSSSFGKEVKVGTDYCKDSLVK